MGDVAPLPIDYDLARASRLELRHTLVAADKLARRFVEHDIERAEDLHRRRQAPRGLFRDAPGVLRVRG